MTRLPEDLLAAARARWPSLKVEPAAFERALRDGAQAAGLAPEQLAVTDLYLVTALRDGCEHAARIFEDEVLPVADRALVALGAPEWVRAEVHQTLYLRIYGADGRATYSGRGGLSAWLRVVAVREARDHWRREKRETRLENLDALELTAGEDPSLNYLRSTYREAVNDAIREALQDLEPKARNLLRLSVLEGLTVRQIGRLHDVHASTISRWLSATREALVEGTRERLRRQDGLDADSLQSLVRDLLSQLDVSVRRHLESQSSRGTNRLPGLSKKPLAE